MRTRSKRSCRSACASRPKKAAPCPPVVPCPPCPPCPPPPPTPACADTITAAFLTQLFANLNTPQNVAAFVAAMTVDAQLLINAQPPIDGQAAIAATLTFPPEVLADLAIQQITFGPSTGDANLLSAVVTVLGTNTATSPIPLAIALDFDAACLITRMQIFADFPG